MSLFRNISCVLLLLLLLSGCGFRPQYASYADKDHQGLFSHVTIPIIADRYGQVLCNKLTTFLGDTGALQAKYKFPIHLSISNRGIGVERNLNASRFESIVIANYQLIDQATNTSIGQGTCQTSEYYAISKTQIFQSLSAEENAPQRGLDVVARCLTDRLALMLKEFQEDSYRNVTE